MIKKILIIFTLGIITVVSYIYFRRSTVIHIQQVDIIRQLQKNAKKKNLDLTNIRISDDNNLMASLKNITIIMSSNKDIENQLNSLQKITKSFTIERNIKIVDFRFDKIVITYD